MARRVNTKFVITLSVVLAASVAGGVGVIGYRWWRNHNPAILQKRAQTAEQAGDLKAAVNNYLSAANEISKRHELGADDLYVHMADLSMRLSQNADNEDDAIRYYNTAVGGYDSASKENPQNKVANENLLELSYQRAMFYYSGAGGAAWAPVKDIATKMLKTQESVKPHAYLAEAILRQLEAKPEGFLESDLTAVETHVNKALELDPNNGLAVALRAELMLDRANLKAKQNGATDRAFQTIAKQGWSADTTTAPAAHPAPPSSAPGTQPIGMETELAAARAYLKDLTDARNYLEAYLRKNGTHPDVTAEAAVIWLNQCRIFGTDGELGKKALTQAIDLLEQTVLNDANKAQYGQELNRQYLTSSDFDKRAREFYQTLIAKRPDGPQSYILLAEYHRLGGRPAEAAAAYKDAIKHQQIGSGLQAIRNDSYETLAMERIASADMDIAETIPEGLSSDKAKGLLKEAGEFTEKLRTSHASKGIIDLLDGRAQLINRNIPQAMKTLQEADGYLSGDDTVRDWLIETKVLRASANELQSQYGAALTRIGEAIKLNSNDIRLWLARARLCMLTGQFTDAEKAADVLLGDQHKVNEVFDGTFANEARLPQAATHAALQVWASAVSQLGDSKDAKVVWDRLGGDTQDAAAVLEIAQRELNAGENDGAAADAIRVLTSKKANKPEQNIAAYQTAIIARARLNELDKARELADQGLTENPQNSSLQYLKALVNSANGTVSVEDQLKIIDGIKDEFTKQIQTAGVYHGRDFDKEIKALQAAEAIVSSDTDPTSRDRLNATVDGIFSAAAEGAQTAESASALALQDVDKTTDAAARAKDTDESKRQTDVAKGYWDIAQTYAQKAEKLNLDGVGGKLYRGRLDFLKSQGKNGLDLISQAVAQRPDFAQGHLMLGEAYLEQKNNEAALDEFRGVIKLAPNNIKAIEFALQLLVPKGNVATASAANLKEAQDDVAGGLRVAPNDTLFQSYADVLLISDSDIEQAIRRREQTFNRDPDNLRNAEALAELYERRQLMHPPAPPLFGQAPPPKPENKALKLAQSIFAKHSTDLDLADLYAQLLAHDGQVDAGMKIFDPFVASEDKKVRYESLIDRAQFCKQLNRIDDAVASLNAAMQVQPDGIDLAQRMLGDMYYEAGKMDEAAKVYRKLADGITDQDSRDRVLRRMIDAELQLGHYTDADPLLATMDKRLEELYKKNSDYKRDLTELLLLQAYSAVQQKNLSKSLDLLNHVLTIDPENATALFYRANANWTLGDKPKVRDAVLSDLNLARQKDRSLQSRMLLAQIYRSSRNYGEACVVYEEAIDIQPGNANLRMEYTNYLLQLVGWLSKIDPKSNEETARTVRVLDPATKLFNQLQDAQARFQNDENQEQWLLMYAELLSLRGNDDQALLYYAYLHSRDPGQVQICDAYLAELVKTRHFDDAVSIGSSIIDLNVAVIESHPNLVTFYLKRAAGYQGLNKQDKAIADIDKAFDVGVKGAKSTKNYDPFLVALGQATQVLPNELVIQRLKARLEANPSETITQIGLIQVLLTMNRFNDAAAVADSVKLPDDDPTLRTLGLREMATARYMAKQYAAAENDFTELLNKWSPDDVDGLNNFAFMLGDAMNKPKDAIRYAQRAVQVLATESDMTSVVSKSAMVYDTLGWSQYLDGQTDKAIETLHRALTWQPLPTTYLHLATAYIKDKELDDASDAVNRGIELATLDQDETIQDLKSLQAKITDLQQQRKSQTKPK